MTQDLAETGFIDVHAHFMPPVDPAQRPALESGYRSSHFLAPPASSWSPEEAIEFMDARGIGVQMLSIPANLPAPQARAANDYGAKIVAEQPTRFGLLASLPLGEPDAALAEIDHALDDLHADGFVLVSNYDGAYFGDPEFDPVFAELDRRGATVFVHPVQPAGFAATACGRPGPVIEFPFDTARTVVDAIYARRFLKYPNFAMILAHAGGALPVLAHRLATIGTLPWVPNPQQVSSADIADQLAGLYYDTAIAGTPTSLLPLMQSTSPDHVVFGTDFPPAGLGVIDAIIAALKDSPVLSASDVAAMRTNTLRLFPNLQNRLDVRHH